MPRSSGAHMPILNQAVQFFKKIILPCGTFQTARRCTAYRHKGAKRAHRVSRRWFAQSREALGGVFPRAGPRNASPVVRERRRMPRPRAKAEEPLPDEAPRLSLGARLPAERARALSPGPRERLVSRRLRLRRRAERVSPPRRLEPRLRSPRRLSLVAHSSAPDPLRAEAGGPRPHRRRGTLAHRDLGRAAAPAS